MIETHNLTKQFGPIRAVDHVSLTVERGEVLGFLGPNGAGKSTTMKMITGFLRPSSGRVTVSGHDVVRDPLAVKRVIGYLPEGAPGYPDMTPASFLRFVAATRGMTRRETRKRLDVVRSLVHLDGVMRQPIETLSKGFRRRVGIAQALLHDPAVLILDEPTDGLDPNQKHEVRELIRGMSADKCVILSTHILEEVEAVCTRAVIIARGRLVADGTPNELTAQSPGHNAITLRATGNTAGLAEALQHVPEVAAVEPLPDLPEHVRCRVVPRNGAPIAPQIGRMLHTMSSERGLRIEEFTVERGRLDEVFRDVTTTSTSTRRRAAGAV